MGYTVVVAAAAALIARSAKIHSYRVPEAIATRCSGSMPSATRPAARRVTWSPVSAQVSECQTSSSSG